MLVIGKRLGVKFVFRAWLKFPEIVDKLAPHERGVRVGTITGAHWFKAQANVYASRRLPSTPLDDAVAAYDEMPR